MDNGKAIFAMIGLVIALILLISTDVYQSPVESVIVDPEKNERIMGLLEKACAGSGQCYAGY